MLVVCYDRDKCNNVSCQHSNPHDPSSVITTCKAGICQFITKAGVPQETYCIPYTEKPTWEL